MKAVAVKPGEKNSAHLVEIEKPKIDEVADGRGVLVKVLRVGGCGTDREINNAEYGIAPEGSEFLILGHENFGVVEAVGDEVTEFKKGDHVVATVRRPGHSIYDVIGTSDMTTDTDYYERGISRLHGYMAEYYVENADFIVKVPAGMKDVGVLLEPMSVVQKGITQAFEIQRRMHIWKPKRAAVLGTGTVGLLAALTLRLRGIDVVGFGRTPRPYLNADLLEALDAKYVSTEDIAVHDYAAENGAFDIIFEATGYSPIVFDAMQALAKNGVLILSSVTGGDRTAEVPADKLNIEFVLGNKVMVGTVNANREYYESGVQDMSQAVLEFGDWLSRMLTHPVAGLENYQKFFDDLTAETGVIKVFFEVGADSGGLD